MNTPADSTHIGKSVTIHGELSGDEDLVFDGTIDGAITLRNNLLTVGANAHVQGDLTVRDLVVYGVVKGNVRAAGRIELRESARLNGDLVASRLSIEENASIQGKVELTGKTASGTGE